MRTTVAVKVVGGIILAALALLVAFPLYWAVSIALRPDADLFTQRILPSALTFENFRQILFEKNWAGFEAVSFLVPLRNSLVVSLTATLLSLVISTPAGYALATFNIRGKNLIATYILLAYVFPPFILIVALYSMIQAAGLYDRLLGLSALHLVLVVPYCTWMLRGYFSTVPRELHESALIDGCTRGQTLRMIVLPVTGPGVASAAIFSFTLSWQDLLFTLVTLTSFEKFTLPIALRSMVVGDFVRWGSLMGGVFITIVPPMILYLVMQRFVIQGLTAGAVKG
ncbi:MAG: carbohydrate ABC transporter permease [Spirochaetales bacterium]|nr:carbohydrate ABC transporter permease [Spirochaetales bacterium]